MKTPFYICVLNHSNMQPTITFDAPTFKSFKQDYRKAVENKQEIFIFKGHQFLTDYAKYVIGYLNSKMN